MIAPHLNPLPAPGPGLAARVGSVIDSLKYLIAYRLSGNPGLYHLMMPLSGYLARTQHRFARLVARFESGTLPAPRTARPRTARPRTARSSRCPCRNCDRSGHAGCRPP